MYLEKWLARQPVQSSEPTSKEMLLKLRELRLKLTDTLMTLPRGNEEDQQLYQLIKQLESSLVDKIRQIEIRVERSFDRKLTRR